MNGRRKLHRQLLWLWSRRLLTAALLAALVSALVIKGLIVIYNLIQGASP